MRIETIGKTLYKTGIRVKEFMLICAVLVISLPVMAKGDDAEGIHLFMLTGEDNMINMDENIAFVPSIEEALGQDKVVVVKLAYARKGIAHWSRSWECPEGATARKNDYAGQSKGWIFHELSEKVRAAVGDKKVKTLSLIWIQGESDALGLASAYRDGFNALLGQFSEEFDRKDLNVVIARLPDLAERKRYPDWEKIREIQMSLGEASERSAWIDTDDCNTSENTARFEKGGSEIVGERLAQKAVEVIRNNKSSAVPKPLPPSVVIKGAKPVHLILLSGQSNMANLDKNEAFVPAVNEAFGEENVVVVKAAYGAKAISHWYAYSKGKNSDDKRGWLYKELIGKTRYRMLGKEIESLTLVWMQGENDASKSETASIYVDNFNQVLDFIREDFDREEINYVVGRLSDCSDPAKWPEWNTMRRNLEKLGDASPRGAWIDTDDCNGPDDNLHYPSGPEGRIKLAKRFAATAIDLIRANDSK